MEPGDTRPFLKFGIALTSFLIMVQLFFQDYEYIPKTLLSLALFLPLWRSSGG